MASKIIGLTVVGNEGYYVGKEYHGLLLDRIEDKSVEFENALTIIYHGYTKENDFVFEVINAPIDVEYGVA
jgi:hypothetical protein